MGILTRNVHKTRADPVTMWLNGADARDILCPIGYTPLSKNEEIRRCVYKIADLVSNMTIMLMENGTNGDIRLKNELAKKIDVYPNKNMTRKNFIHKIVTDMILAGNSVVYPKVKNGLIDDLQILRATDLNFYEMGDSYDIHYRSTTFAPDEVLHFVLNPDDEYPFEGQGYTQMIKQTVLNLLQATATKTGFGKELVGGGMLNRNEGRAEFDYSPVDVDGMNDFTVLENYLQVADLSKQKKLVQGGDGVVK